MGEKVIEISGLSKRFENKVVFKNFSMQLFRGETLVIIGKSGAGKSVLLKCITGLIEPDAGEVFVFGKNIPSLNDLQINEIRNRMGFLFQGAALYDSMTVYENLLFPLQRNRFLKDVHPEYRISEALASVGLSDATNLMPSELSGGMKKRAGLARTLVKQPEIILYDEPTTGLDPFNAREISELILSVQKQHCNSGIVVTHDMGCAEIVADRMLVMDDGECVEEGSFNELSRSINPKVMQFFQ